MDNKQPDKEIQTSNQPAVEDSEEEENEILEESPCGRWLKRTEEVEQNNIPGIDATYLAMDTEDGVEVVWNEVRFSERKYFKAKEETINNVFDRLIQLEHPNIVKLHKYWLDKESETPRVIFITEYMSSGSLKQFIQKTKRHVTALQNWRRWCTQTLSALCYLHSSQPPIVHGNLNCDTIFISYNGLIKIGAIAPDSIHRYVKTVRSDSHASNLHFIAPEVGMTDGESGLSPAIDIYAFGMCALEMAVLEISTGDESNHHITQEDIQRTIDSLENPMQKDFIQRCLHSDPAKRSTARDLLFHPIIFEVPSLRLFCAHLLMKTHNQELQPEQLTEEAISRFLCKKSYRTDFIVAEVPRLNGQSLVFKTSDFPNHELEKFLDEVRNGALPLTAVSEFSKPAHVSRQKTISPEVVDDAHKLINTPEYPYDEETRKLVYINCCIQPLTDDGYSCDVKFIMKLDDKINRQLTCEITQDQFIPASVAQELVYYGFINKDDKDVVANILLEAFNESRLNPSHGACCEKTFTIQQKGQPAMVPQPQPPPPVVLAQPVPIIPAELNTMPVNIIQPSAEAVLLPAMNDMTLNDAVVVNNVNNNNSISIDPAATAGQQDPRLYYTEEQQLASLEYQQQFAVPQQQQFTVPQQQLPPPTYIGVDVMNQVQQQQPPPQPPLAVVNIIPAQPVPQQTQYNTTAIADLSQQQQQQQQQYVSIPLMVANGNLAQQTQPYVPMMAAQPEMQEQQQQFQQQPQQLEPLDLSNGPPAPTQPSPTVELMKVQPPAQVHYTKLDN